jgi:hypothetical protein
MSSFGHDVVEPPLIGRPNLREKVSVVIALDK